jgi:hypothetical protein
VWELPGNKGATLANVLEVLKAQPGDHMTVIVMELCDRWVSRLWAFACCCQMLV